jgi:hypothetical protein
MFSVMPCSFACRFSLIRASRFLQFHLRILLEHLRVSLPQQLCDPLVGNAAGTQPRRVGGAMRGRAEHRSVADRAVPTSPLQCLWRIPSQFAKPPLPSSHLPRLFSFFLHDGTTCLDQLRLRRANPPVRFSPNREREPSECGIPCQPDQQWPSASSRCWR